MRDSYIEILVLFAIAAGIWWFLPASHDRCQHTAAPTQWKCTNGAIITKRIH